jgi:hypothetical protein
MRAQAARPEFWAVALGIVAAAVYTATYADPTPFNHYVLLADAFLHGRVDLVAPPDYLEHTTFRGRHYVIPPPGPALLLLPAVAVFGVAVDQSRFAALAGAVAAASMLLIGARLLPRRADYLWVGVLAAFGTIAWHMAATGSTWLFAHVLVMTALAAGVLEALGRQRPVLLGAAAAWAFLCRQPAIMAFPFFLLVTLPRWAPGGLRALRRLDLGYLNRLVAPVALAVAANGLYNWVRFGTVADVANPLRPGILQEPWFAQGLFHWSYIPRHLEIVFLKLPVVSPDPPYLLVPWTGLALWLTTPAFVYALRARLTVETAAAWVGVLGVLLVVFTYGNPGVSQFGYRFASDVYPLLLLLALRGMGERVPALAKVLILVGVVVNAWGVVWMRGGWVAP